MSCKASEEENDIFNSEAIENSDDKDVTPAVVDSEIIYAKFENEIEEGSIIESVEQFASEFDEQNREVINYFDQIEFENIIVHKKAATTVESLGFQ